MWVITGPFDGEGAAPVELASLKSKLLKAGKSYSLGRKNQPLIVSSKKVSSCHCTFAVGQSTLNDVHDPEKRPTLTFQNERDKTMRLIRMGSQQTLESKMILELQDGDVIHIVTGIPISVKWQQICCYSPSLKGRPNVSLETCAQLGISIVYTSDEHVTHHILPTYLATASVATSLISAAQFVKFEWLLEVLENEASLEENFILPNVSKFRPTFSPSLGPSQKVFRVWEPNEERFNIFSEFRFLIFGEGSREIESDLRDLIRRGGGFIETFDVTGGVAKLHKALTRGQAKENQRLVAVADVNNMKAAVGANEWKRLTDEVQGFGLPIIYPEIVVQAVVEVEPSLLTALTPSPATTNVLGSAPRPNSISEEPSILPEETLARKRLIERAASRQPSTEPAPQIIEGIKIETPKPRRLLLSRRAKTIEPRASVEPPDQPLDAQAPTLSRIRLKRRLGVASTSVIEATGQSQLPEIPSVVEDEPPLKKFKALFDANDPACTNATELFDEKLDLGKNTGASPTQSHLEGFVRSVATGTSLSVLREEEEESSESGNGARSQMRGAKRKLDDIQQEGQDIEIIDVNAVNDDGQPAKKRQALDSTREANDTASISSMRLPEDKRAETKRNSGAPFGKPDMDDAFLRAVASTKRGKRIEDDFDREFNGLRISKPKAVGQDLQRREEAEWKGFTDFGDDTGLRGNFMVVLEMDVYKKKNNSHSSRGAAGSREKGLPDGWKDQPNFKKFKKKILPARRALIELVVSEDNNNDFGITPTHWKNRKSTMKRVGNFSQETRSKDHSNLPRASAQATIILSDNETPPALGKRSATTHPTRPSSQEVSRDPSMTRAASRLPSSRPGPAAPTPTKRKNAAANSKTLFLDSDDDIENEEYEQRSHSTNSKEVYNDDDDQTLWSSESRTKWLMGTSTTRSRVGGRAGQVAAADDDSDDGAVFKGFGRRKR